MATTEDDTMPHSAHERVQQFTFIAIIVLWINTPHVVQTGAMPFVLMAHKLSTLSTVLLHTEIIIEIENATIPFSVPHRLLTPDFLNPFHWCISFHVNSVSNVTSKSVHHFSQLELRSRNMSLQTNLSSGQLKPLVCSFVPVFNKHRLIHWFITAFRARFVLCIFCHRLRFNSTGNFE